MRIGTFAALAVCLLIPLQAAAEVGTPQSMFPKGLWAMQLTGSFYESIEANDEMATTVAVSADYYFDHRHCFRMELLGYNLDNDGGDDSVAIGANLGLRYHFLEYERLTLFVEGVVGIFQAGDKFPAGGTHFNFNEQLGLGLTFRLDERTHFIGGGRFIHVSNAAIRGKDENPSFNGVGGYIGLLFTF